MSEPSLQEEGVMSFDFRKERWVDTRSDQGSPPEYPLLASFLPRLLSSQPRGHGLRGTQGDSDGGSVVSVSPVSRPARASCVCSCSDWAVRTRTWVFRGAYCSLFPYYQVSRPSPAPDTRKAKVKCAALGLPTRVPLDVPFWFSAL